MLYELYAKEGVCAEEKLKNGEDDAKTESTFKEQCFRKMQEMYVSQASEAAHEPRARHRIHHKIRKGQLSIHSHHRGDVI